jgi:tetratricopeptide (TPR) repeat protein
MQDESSTKTASSGEENLMVHGQPPGPVAGIRNLPSWLGIAVVLAVTFAVYSQTLQFQFVHDDVGQIVENFAVHSWSSVPTYFSSHVWEGFDPTVLGNYFRPIFLLWLRINDAVFGNEAWGWHFSTILIHLLTTFLVYLLIQRVGLGRVVAVLAALIFGLHPSHIEAVSWISGGTEPLLGIFLIASLLCYLRSRPGADHVRLWKLTSLAFFAMGLLEKETAVIFPGFLLAYEWINGPEWGKPLQMRRVLQWSGGAIREIWAYFLVILLYLPARIHALKGFSHLVTPLSTRQLLFTWPELIWFWIRHLLWPVGLSTFYDLPAVLHPTLRNFTLRVILDVCAGLVLLVCARRTRPAAFFATWLVLPLIPVLNIRAFAADDFAHDRYLYLPSVGLAVLVAVVLKKVLVGQPRYFGLPASLLVAMICLAAALGYGTAKESFYFKDNLNFYAYNFTRAPHNPVVEADYASILGENGFYGPALQVFADMMKRYPDDWAANYNLAYTYYRMGRLPEAEEHFRRAIRSKPGKAGAYLYLGMTLLRMGRLPDAIAAVRQAIAIYPQGRAYHFALGVMLKTQGDLTGASSEFRAELANYPDEQRAADQLREIENQGQGSSRSGAQPQ